MPHIQERTVYTFDELSDQAKKKAREWFRDGALDHEWWDCIEEDAKTCGSLMGIEVSKLYFTGFWSQGDGACFDGSYRYAKGGAKAIRNYAPNDVKLHKIADDLQALQRCSFYKITAHVKHRGHYYHSRCTEIDVDDARDMSAEESVSELLRDFMDWIYRSLEHEHNWLLADAQVDESIRANEYEFDANGKIS
jgi:hypothetical protein